MIFTISEFSKLEILNFFPINENKIRIIYPGLTKKFISENNFSTSKQLLSVSSLDPRKNLKFLIKAFLAIDNRSFKLKLVGEYNNNFRYDDELHYLINTNIDRIVFSGYISDEDLIEEYSKSLAFISASIYEGFGLPLIEAQASGCPVLASDIPVYKEVLGDSAVFFKNGSKYDFIDKIIYISNKKNRVEYIDKGFKNIKKYSWRKSAKKLDKIINS